MSTQSCLLADMLPPGYGYVVFTAASSLCLNQFLSYQVMKARKKYSVEYPDMYSEEYKNFNCIQRAHLNTLEMSPAFLYTLLLGGLRHPHLATGFGWIWIVGRVQFARGYCSKNPEKRQMGFFGVFGMMGLIGCTFSLALDAL